MIIINKEQAKGCLDALKAEAVLKETVKAVRNIYKDVYVFNNCEFEVFTQDKEIVRIDVYKYDTNGRLYDLEERIVR